MAYVYRYIDLDKQETVYVGKVTKDNDVGYMPLENRDRQHSREDWYKEIGEDNLLLQYIECSHTDADIYETWLINYYGDQLINIAKQKWGKSNIDLGILIFGKWRNWGQNRHDMEEMVYKDINELTNILIKSTETFTFDIEYSLQRFCEGVRRIRNRVIKCDRISRINMQDDFLRSKT